MKIKHSFLLWELVFLLFVSCGEKQNYLSGQIEGLELGDCIIWGLIDPITDEIYISDSTIVEKKNHFDLYTKATDQWAYLAHCPKNEKIKSNITEETDSVSFLKDTHLSTFPDLPTISTT